jgi:hypothetical protein
MNTIIGAILFVFESYFRIELSLKINVLLNWSGSQCGGCVETKFSVGLRPKPYLRLLYLAELNQSYFVWINLTKM